MKNIIKIGENTRPASNSQEKFLKKHKKYTD